MEIVEKVDNIDAQIINFLKENFWISMGIVGGIALILVIVVALYCRNHYESIIHRLQFSKAEDSVPLMSLQHQS